MVFARQTAYYSVMPELPEVETVCQGLRARVIGKRFAEVTLYRSAIRFPIPPEIAFITGYRITRIDRHSKYILIVLENHSRVLVHLGMTGKLFYTQDAGYAPQKHDHVLFRFDGKNDGILVFNDARRFGVVDYIPAGQTAHRLLDVLGIDPLSPALTPQFLAEKFRKKSLSMKAALMDQRLVAGLGNIYVCEALFRAGIDPRRPAGSLRRNEAAKLEKAIRAVLHDALQAGGSSLRDYVDANGDQGLFQHHFDVYGREEQPCHKCATPVRRIVQTGRSSFFCPSCQKP